MPVVLGIDPAWTVSNPSGVALLTGKGGRWRCLGVAPSYEGFIALAQGIPVNWGMSAKAGAPPPAEILHAAEALAPGSGVDAVAVDMPVSRVRFDGRRFADDAATRALGRFGCGVHSPTPSRPGPLGAGLNEGFAARGFEVATTEPATPGMRPLLEVYPHPAAIALLRADYRVPYEVARTAKYWPERSVDERINQVLGQWGRLLAALGETIEGIELPLPKAADGLTLSGLKRFEDALDALICAWVGTQYLEGRCVPLGDRTAAIWVPATLGPREGAVTRSSRGARGDEDRVRESGRQVKHPRSSPQTRR